MNQTTHKMTDPIQIKHYKEDITSFNQLYKEFQRRFVRFANTYVRDLTTAEDITIEAMMYYWENRQSLSEDSNIPAYILTIIKNKCLNYLRHQQIHEEYSDKIKDYYEWELNTRIATLQACEPYELFISEIQELVQQTLTDMPEKTRTIFMLSRYENKSYKEIAVLMNITPKGVDFYNPQIQISAESETKRSIFREKDKTKRSKKESAQHSKSRNKSFVMTSVSAL